MKNRMTLIAFTVLLSFLSAATWAGPTNPTKQTSPVSPLKTEVKSNPTNPASGSDIKPMLKPDLTIIKMSINPAKPTPQDTITFSALVINTGPVAAPASKAGIKIGGETSPVPFKIPALQPQASQTITRQMRLDRQGNYIAKFIADVDNEVAESNENNNIGERNFQVGYQPVVITEESMLTYTIPGHKSFAIYLKPSKLLDSTTVTDTAIQVQVRYFQGGSLQQQKTLSGHFVSKQSPINWQSDETNLANSCTNSPSSYCLVDVTLQDTVMAQDGGQLDGDKNGQPGGNYHHQFHRGMAQP